MSELSDYLDDTLDPEMKADLHRHVSECPNCWVVCNTTEKTIKIYKGMEPQAIPPEVEKRFMSALMEKCKRAKRKAENPPPDPPSPS
ncbi:MAG: zf-HC2 domain-containing protein [Bryobacteraceae bacterium]